MSVQRLRIADLLAAIPADFGTHLDAGRVEEYMTMLDRLQPIVVFRTPDGLLLTDGYQRLAAARRVGAETIEAEVRTGSKADALRYAVEVGAAQKGMSPEEVEAHILRRFEWGRRSEP